jgi:hypothetical protein
MSQEFKKTILEWNSVQEKIKETSDQIAPYQKRLKLYKDQADGLETKIVGYMQENKMGNSKIEMGNIVITMGETKRMESVSKDYLIKKAKEFFRDDKTANKFIDFVYSTRQQSVNNCLKRKIKK